MGRPVITREEYERWLEAFRTYPGQYHYVGNAMKSNHHAARKAWEIGWPGQDYEPIMKVVEREQTLARAVRVKMLGESEAHNVAEQVLKDAQKKADELVADADRKARGRMAELYTQANIDAAQQRAEEAQLTVGVRRNVMAAVGVTAGLLRNANELVRVVGEDIKGGKLTGPQAAAYCKLLVRMIRDVNEAGQTAMQMERLRVGDPTEVVEVRVEPTSLTEAAAEMEHAMNVLQLMRERGLVSGVPGDAREPSEPENN